MAKGDRLLAVARPRMILPTAAVVWTAAEIMHAEHIGPLWPGLATAALGVILPRTGARPLTTVAVAAGAWVTTATAYGAAAGPHHLMAWIWAAAAITGAWKAWRHPAVRLVRDNRKARHEWLHKAARYRLHGSHMIHREVTNHGDIREYDTKGTGRLASQIAASDLAERIAQDEGLPLSAVQVTNPRPGRIRVLRRYEDPWEHSILHPLLAEDPEIEFPAPSTIRQPVIFGQDPETGDPLSVPLYDEIGAKAIMVVARRREGKTVVLNNIKERVTAAEDADLWQINVSKGLEDHYWAPAAEHSAAGDTPEAKKKALQILQAARDLVMERGRTPRRTKIFQPTKTDRLKVLIIDEIDELVEAHPAWVRKTLGKIASKAGSEGVTLIAAGQRATTDWMAGNNTKVNMDWLILGKVDNFGEVNHAAGAMAMRLPDMSTYGEGGKGVWVVAEKGAGFNTGRAFDLSELDDIERFANERAVHRVPAMAGPAGGEPPEKLPASNLPAGDDGPSPGDPLQALDEAIRRDDPHALADAVGPAAEEIGQHREREEQEFLDAMDPHPGDVPPDLQDQFRRIDEQNRDTKRILDENASRPPLPDVPPDKKVESATSRWEQAIASTVIPDPVRRKLLELLANGTTTKQATEALGESRWTVSLYLKRLEADGVARLDGKGAGARWYLAEGDGQ